MNFLLDTTVLIDSLRGRRNRRALLSELVGAGHALATGTINVGEVYAGMRPTEEQITTNLISNLDCYPLTLAIARRAGSLKYAAARRRKALTLADMIVAATALEHDLILVTDNRKDFPLPQLKFHHLS